jgi:hypothetical protein
MATTSQPARAMAQRLEIVVMPLARPLIEMECMPDSLHEGSNLSAPKLQGRCPSARNVPTTAPRGLCSIFLINRPYFDSGRDATRLQFFFQKIGKRGWILGIGRFILLGIRRIPSFRN